MSSSWQALLKERLQLFGHRNWLVIADSAYPAQSRHGTETIITDEEQTPALIKAFEILHECKHIRPTIYTDTELAFVLEEDAPGITSYRKQLSDLLSGYEVQSLLHEEIISRLDRVSEVFRVLSVKTKMRIPYTSVFVELDCGYWNAQAEDRLRAAMRAKNQELDVPTRRKAFFAES
jgi:L-fucose mutarotase/ribose pyranase (RbsD/FucU family)